MQNKLIFLMIYILSWGLLAQVLSGEIPKKYLGKPARDLLHGQRQLLPEEAHQLFLSSGGAFELWKLNPIASDIWKNEFPRYLDEEQLDDLDLNELDEVSFASNHSSLARRFRFNVKKVDSDGRIKYYNILLANNQHNVLMAKTLLRKIGYKIPATKHVSKLKLTFDSPQHRASFDSARNTTLLFESKNWIEEDASDFIILKDVIVFETDLDKINFAIEFNPLMFLGGTDVVQNRRVLSSLLVAHALVNNPGSVNFFKWYIGLETPSGIALELESAPLYRTQYNDAKWIADRILKLNESDFRDIVQSTRLPGTIQALLFEKLKARRNSLGTLFQLDTLKLPVNSSVSQGQFLKDGKLLKDKWEGYGPVFAYEDAENPLSGSEAWSFFWSKLIGLGIDSGVGFANFISGIDTDIKEMNAKAINEIVTNNYASNIIHGDISNTNIKTWMFPTFQGNLILSRNVVTGNYLGTNNRVQLVDTFGFTAGAGMFVGTAGFAPPIFANASTNVNVTRVYAHVKPLTSVQKAIKSSYKNLIVPLIKMRYGKELKKAVKLNDDQQDSETEPADVVANAYQHLKENMGVGESLIVTDQLDAGIAVRVGANYAQLAQVQLGISPAALIISRLHIHRASEDTIHIYRDIGNVASVNFSLNANLGVPIVKVNFKTASGKVHVKFYSVNMSEQNQNRDEDLEGLQFALLKNSVKKFKEIGKKPFELFHKFKEKTPSLGLLVARHRRLNQSTQIELRHPRGGVNDIKYFYKAIQGHSTGLDYQSFLTDAVSYLSGNLLNVGVFPSGLNEVNPGHSYLGRASNKILQFEAELDRENNTKESYVRLSRFWNGWSATQKRAQTIIERMQNRYRYDFYHPHMLSDTEKIRLYKIGINFHIYDSAIKNMLMLKPSEVKNIFTRFSSKKNKEISKESSINFDPQEGENKIRLISAGHKRFLKFKEKYLKFSKTGNLKKSSQYLLKMISLVELKLTMRGIVQVFGGADHILVESQIEGFREGDVAAEERQQITDILSNTLGRFGSENRYGPILKYQRATGMISGEFDAAWLMGRLL